MSQENDFTDISKAWYLFPIILWWIGGLIAFFALRKRNRRVAYKNLILGIIITVVFSGIIMASSSPTSNIQHSDAYIKRNAVTIPHESLMNNPETHKGEIVYFKGEILQVVELFDQYDLRVKIEQTELFSSDDIWVNYTPKSDEEKAWLDSNIKDTSEIFKVSDNDVIKIWGVSKGLKEYSALIGKITVPEIDAIIIENDGKPTAQASTVSLLSQPRSSHMISYSEIPSYVDKNSVINSISSTIEKWDNMNPNVDFSVVNSNGDVNINWVRYMQGSGLGLHRANVIDDGTRDRHSIIIRLGIDDCHSNYQQFTEEMLQYIIAHEIGHYLGLRHIDDKNHLMYSGEFYNVDSVDVYDNLSLGIPSLKRPDVATIEGVEIKSKIDSLNAELELTSAKRQDLKNSGASLNQNTRYYNYLVAQIDNLEDQLSCVNLK